MDIGIMGAMPEEVDQLCARLSEVTVEEYGGGGARPPAQPGGENHRIDFVGCPAHASASFPRLQNSSARIRNG